MSAYRGDAGPDLGPLVDEVRPNRGPVTAFLVLSLFIALIVDASALASRPTTLDRWMVVIMFGIASPVLALLARFGRQPDGLRIHQHGFVSGKHAIRWEDVTEVRTQRYVSGRRTRVRSTLDRHTLRTSSGETLDLRFAFADNDRVLREVHERSREHLLRNTTLPAKFGAITVDDSGVRTEYASLSWPQISGASLDGPASQVVVRGPGSTWIEAPLHEVPNAHVLCALVNKRATAGARS